MLTATEISTADDVPEGLSKIRNEVYIKVIGNKGQDKVRVA